MVEEINFEKWEFSSFHLYFRDTKRLTTFFRFRDGDIFCDISHMLGFFQFFKSSGIDKGVEELHVIYPHGEQELSRLAYRDLEKEILNSQLKTGATCFEYEVDNGLPDPKNPFRLYLVEEGILYNEFKKCDAKWLRLDNGDIVCQLEQMYNFISACQKYGITKLCRRFDVFYKGAGSIKTQIDEERADKIAEKMINVIDEE